MWNHPKFRKLHSGPASAAMGLQSDDENGECEGTVGCNET